MSNDEAPDFGAVRDEMLRRAEGMPRETYAEIYEGSKKDQRRLEAPSMLLDTAEASAVFQGLNHERDQLQPVIDLVEELGQPERASQLIEDYDRRRAAASAQG